MIVFPALKRRVLARYFCIIATFLEQQLCRSSYNVCVLCVSCLSVYLVCGSSYDTACGEENWTRLGKILYRPDKIYADVHQMSCRLDGQRKVLKPVVLAHARTRNTLNVDSVVNGSIHLITNTGESKTTYCKFELNWCTRNGAAYISAFRLANLMFLDCVNSFGDRSSWRNRRIIDSIMATLGYKPPR